MSDTNVEVLKALRQRTGAGFVACRNALVEAEGDTERAADILRAQETRLAQAKAQRTATQGLIGTRITGSRGAILEVNCESDFVARSTEFVAGVSECLRIALEDDAGDGEAVQGNGHIAAVLTSLSARTGERILLRRARIVPVLTDEIVATYVHGGPGNDVGRIGVVVATNFPRSAEANVLARGVGMHIAASAPVWVSADEIPPELIDAKRAEFEAEATRAGKSAVTVARIVRGRLDKYLAESTLLQQAYALNPDSIVGDVLQAAGQSWGLGIAVRQYVRFQVGEADAARHHHTVAR